MSKKIGVVIGVGAERGNGAHLSGRFARLGLKVFVVGRTLEQLEKVCDAIKAGGGEAVAFAADATSEADMRKLFDAVGSSGDLDLAIYNVGNNMPGAFLDIEADYFEVCWRTACFGAFLFGREAGRIMAARGGGTLLFTGASASLRGRANFGAFAAAKGGLRNMVQSAARELAPQGVHVAQVFIDGPIDGDRINLGRPLVAAAAGQDGLIDRDGLADIYEMLYRQRPRAWTHEIDVRTFKEPF